MYCKKCGKKISDNARFCDRCGQPVPAQRPQPKKRELDSYDRYRKKKMQKEAQRRRQKKRVAVIVVWAIIIAVIVSVAGGLYAHNYIMKNAPDGVQAMPGVSPTPKPSETVEPTASTAAKSEEPDDSEGGSMNSASDEGCQIYIDNVYGFRCPYPSEFEVDNLSNQNTRLSLKDAEGGGRMIISYEKISDTDNGASLMRDYVGGIGVSPEYNRAGENWYSVSFVRNGKVNHRKGIIINGTEHVYYDFTYDQLSDKKAKYEDYTDYIDEFLDTQTEGAASRETQKPDSTKD